MTSEGIYNYKFITSIGGANGTSANIGKPIFWYSEVNDVCPALILHSNPLQTDKGINPWRDVIIPSEGVAYYNGDNKFADRSPGANPENGGQSGNNKIESLINLYKSHKKEDRLIAPPIMIFEQVKHDGKVKGYRAFKGLGIINKTHVRQQYEDDTDRVFSNYLFEIILFKLPHDGLNWNWITDRRNPKLSKRNQLRNAPESWKKWVNEGEACLETVRQKILGYSIATPKEQLDELLPGHIKILDAIIKHYKTDRNETKFEALASLAAEEYFGELRYTRGWITPQSGDMGVDFIGRYDFHHPEVPQPLGTVLGTTSFLVIGQAKCRFHDKAEVARDIARVASRLQRGCIGIYITTATFSRSVQHEVSLDEYPMILINGRQLADLVASYIKRTGKKLTEVLSEQDQWCVDNIKHVPPRSILHDQIPS